MNITSLIALHCLRGIGHKTVLQVANEVPTAPVLFREYVDSKFSRQETEAQAAWDQALQIIDRCEQLEIHVVAVTDPTIYPQRFHSLNGRKPKPSVLYIKGSIDALQHNHAVIAGVGTRHPTENGIKSAYDFGCFAAENHIPVVSGLAYGCDVYAHQGCIDHNGTAIAVMAHGLDMVYPSEHRELAHQIVEQNGCLVSEYPPGVKMTKWSFVDRDRLQSGLSDSVIVIQTGRKGGTRHTARFAQEQGMSIFCVKPHRNECNHPMVEGVYEMANEQNAEWIETPN